MFTHMLKVQASGLVIKYDNADLPSAYIYLDLISNINLPKQRSISINQYHQICSYDPQEHCLKAIPPATCQSYLRLRSIANIWDNSMVPPNRALIINKQ